ncbi:MAG: class I adenylate-forming enzyme family protein, partial [Erythrobacter sp.]
MNDLAQAIDFVPPANWPAMSRQECVERLTAPGQRFEMETIDIHGVPTRVWKNAPANLRQVAMAGRAHGDRLFAIYGDERVTYDAWFRAVARLATEFRARGIGKGDRVALAMRNLPEWPVAFFAATTVGAICVPLNAWWTGPELAFGLANSGSKLLVCDAERWERLAEHRAEFPELETLLVSRGEQALEGTERLEDIIGTPNDYAALPQGELPPEEIAPEDEATIFYTSGTTGQPKGALGTHRNLCTNILSSGFNGAFAALRRGEVPPEPVQKVGLTVIPLFHVTACSAGLMGYVVAGHTLVFMHKWDPVKAFQLIEREKVNLTGGVPTIAWQLLEHPERKNYDLSSLEAIAYGGGAAAAPPGRQNHRGARATAAAGAGRGGERGDPPPASPPDPPHPPPHG